MTTTKSTSKFFNPSKPALTNFFLKIKSNKKLLIISAVLQLLGLPLGVGSLISHSVVSANEQYGISNYEVYAVIGILCLGGATLTGIIVAMNNFAYLYKKQNVDMAYSLPLSTKTRFFSDFLSGLAVYFVPYFVAVLITVIMHLLCLGIFPAWAKDCSENAFSQELFTGCFCLLLVMLMLYTLTVLVLDCCGSIFEAITYTVLVNGLIPGTIAVACYSMFNSLCGINIENTVLNTVGFTSPLGGVIMTAYILASILDNRITPYYEDLSYHVSFIRWTILYVLLIAIMFVLAYFLYRKRKAEDVSKPFVFKGFYYVIITSIIYCIASLVTADDYSYIIPVIIMTAIVYMIFEVITNRGFKKFYKSVIKYIITIMAVFALPVIVSKTHGFGMEYYVPSASSVKSVYVEYEGFNDNLTQYKDRTIIENVIAMNRDVVNCLKNDDEYRKYMLNQSVSQNYVFENQVPEFSVSLSYMLRDGRMVSREYSVTREQLNMLDGIQLNEASIEKLVNTIKGQKRYSSYNYDDKILRPEGVSPQSKANISVTNKYNDQIYYQINEEFIDRLADAYRKDLESLTLDEIKASDIYAKLFNNENIVVYNSCENTVKLLKDEGIVPRKIENTLKSYFEQNNTTDTYYPVNSISITMFTPDEYQSFTGDNYTASFGSFVVKGNKNHTIIINNFNLDKALKLFEVARTNCITSDNCYVFIFNNQRYVVPAEYSDIAEEMLSEYGKTSLISDYDILSAYAEHNSNIYIGDGKLWLSGSYAYTNLIDFYFNNDEYTDKYYYDDTEIVEENYLYY